MKKEGVFRIVSAVFALCLFTGAAGAEDNTDSAREALAKWVETRRIISQEKHDFKLGREMLNERIELVEREIKSLQGKISDTEGSITELDKKRMGLVAENDGLKIASATLSNEVDGLEALSKKLLLRLPDPIRERVKPLSQRFPERPDETKLSLGERFQNIVGVLNEVSKFNREITLASEVRNLPDGTSAEVTTIYVGIGKAYYVNNKGDIAGIGSASENGWRWRTANEAAPEIARAIAILKNEQAAAFTQLPVEIN